MITALSAAGMASDRFSFEGFLPVKEKAKQDKLMSLIEESRTMIFYESPRRIKDTVEQIIKVMGPNKKLVIARELTKTFESFYTLDAQEMLVWLNEDTNHCRGEFVLMIAGAKKSFDEIPQEVLNTLKLLKEELPLKKAAALTAKIYNEKKNDLYKWGLENL